jgi:hypothetical protein
MQLLQVEYLTRAMLADGTLVDKFEASYSKISEVGQQVLSENSDSPFREQLLSDYRSRLSELRKLIDETRLQFLGRYGSIQKVFHEAIGTAVSYGSYPPAALLPGRLLHEDIFQVMELTSIAIGNRLQPEVRLLLLSVVADLRSLAEWEDLAPLKPRNRAQVRTPNQMALTCLPTLGSEIESLRIRLSATETAAVRRTS